MTNSSNLNFTLTDACRMGCRAGWVIVLMVIFWQACSPNPPGAMVMLNDKLAHALAFLVLGALALLGWTNDKQHNWLLGFLVFVWAGHRMRTILCAGTVVFSYGLAYGYSGVMYRSVAEP